MFLVDICTSQPQLRKDAIQTSLEEHRFPSTIIGIIQNLATSTIFVCEGNYDNARGVIFAAPNGTVFRFSNLCMFGTTSLVNGATQIDWKQICDIRQLPLNTFCLQPEYNSQTLCRIGNCIYIIFCADLDQRRWCCSGCFHAHKLIQFDLKTCEIAALTSPPKGRMECYDRIIVASCDLGFVCFGIDCIYKYHILTNSWSICKFNVNASRIDCCFGYKTYIYFNVGPKLKRFDFGSDEPHCEGVLKEWNGPHFGSHEMWLKDDVLYGLTNNGCQVYYFDLELVLWKFVSTVKTAKFGVDTLIVL